MTSQLPTGQTTVIDASILKRYHWINMPCKHELKITEILPELVIKSISLAKENNFAPRNLLLFHWAK